MHNIAHRLSAVEKQITPPTTVSVERDPLLFASSLGFTLDLWQRELLESTARRIILNVSRQAGKSTVCALMAIHHALTTDNAMVVVLSPSLRQSSLLFRKIMQFYRAAGKPIRALVETTLQLKLRNGSWIVALPGNTAGTIRGFSSITLLLIDECAQISDELYYSALPFLATVPDSRLILLSTPYGTRGAFFHEWTEGRDWLRIQVKATECPRISEKFLNEQRERLGPWWFAQEYETQFMADTCSLFSEDAIRAAFDDSNEEWDL
jgi:hypothetical protein